MFGRLFIVDLKLKTRHKIFIFYHTFKIDVGISFLFGHLKSKQKWMVLRVGIWRKESHYVVSWLFQWEGRPLWSELGHRGVPWPGHTGPTPSIREVRSGEEPGVMSLMDDEVPDAELVAVLQLLLFPWQSSIWRWSCTDLFVVLGNTYGVVLIFLDRRDPPFHQFSWWSFSVHLQFWRFVMQY